MKHLSGQALLLLAAAVISTHGAEPAPARPPNLILFVADDLGYGELGCYGQKTIRTPTLDRLAAEGTRLTQAYSGSAVCAPSRCVLLTGRHSGHASIRDNREIGAGDAFGGQQPLPPEDVTIAQVLKDAGYATACIGKWGLGAPGSSGDPNKHGFDLFFGYNCQHHAHNYYPTYLVRNQEQIPLPGNDGKSATGKTYAPDRMTEEALQFVREHRDKPFFLYWATPAPHLALQVPEDSLKEYTSLIRDDPPYEGGSGYLPHKTPRAAYAAMITRMDRDLGALLKLLDDLGLTRETLVLATSDNGATHVKQVDTEFFRSQAGLRDFKGSLYEGGIRVPLIAWGPGRVPAGRTEDSPCASWDLFPTLCEAAGVRAPGGLDGVNLLPLLLGGSAPAREYLYWEFPGYGGQQAVRLGDWKGIRTNMGKSGNLSLELYNLREDPFERSNVAAAHPNVVERMLEVMQKARVPNPEFPLRPLDPDPEKKGGS